jgi:hypothetical protein
VCRGATSEIHPQPGPVRTGPRNPQHMPTRGPLRGRTARCALSSHSFVLGKERARWARSIRIPSRLDLIRTQDSFRPDDVAIRLLWTRFPLTVGSDTTATRDRSNSLNLRVQLCPDLCRRCTVATGVLVRDWPSAEGRRPHPEVSSSVANLVGESASIGRLVCWGGPVGPGRRRECPAGTRTRTTWRALRELSRYLGGSALDLGSRTVGGHDG